jgi:N-acetyl-gamma-glutamyl-phosphate reductase
MPFEPRPASYLSPDTLNGTNRMELFVFENSATRHVLLVARLDNLGKGASGAAAQNIDLMLGLKGEDSYDLAR